MNVEALKTLWNCTQRHHGTSGARTCVCVLLGLYNGRRFPFDLVSLRGLDNQYLGAAMAVILSDATRCEKEVHEWLNQITGRHDFGMRFEILAYQYRLKGRCKKEHLDPVPNEGHLFIGNSEEAVRFREELGVSEQVAQP